MRTPMNIIFILYFKAKMEIMKKLFVEGTMENQLKFRHFLLKFWLFFIKASTNKNVLIFM